MEVKQLEFWGVGSLVFGGGDNIRGGMTFVAVIVIVV
jgi:hypothetical protein